MAVKSNVTTITKSLTWMMSIALLLVLALSVKAALDGPKNVNSNAAAKKQQLTKGTDVVSLEKDLTILKDDQLTEEMDALEGM